MRLETIRAKLAVLAAGSFVVAGAIGVTGYWGIHGVAVDLRVMSDAGRVLRNHMEADMMHDALRADVLAAFQASNANERAQVRKDLDEHTRNFRERLAANDALDLPADVRTALTAVLPALDAYIDSADKVIAAALDDPAAAKASLLPGFLQAFSALESRMSDLSDGIEAGVARTDADANAHVAASTSTTLAVGAAASAVLGVLLFWVGRSITKRLEDVGSGLRRTTSQVLDVSRSVSESAQNLSQGATAQAASLQQTSASMEEMASMTRKNAENLAQAAQLIGEVDRLVGGANRSLDDMTRSMGSIRDSSSRVSKIIKTIDEIAFQTNILALNAAVEAARAGEAGMGFAVVADEVRNLAQRSAQAAKDTASLIEESIANSQEGDTKVEQVAQSISAITTSVATVKGLVTEISEASRQQSQGIDQVTHAVVQMEQVTQSTAASAEQSAAASEELSSHAELTMAEVARLEDMAVRPRDGNRPTAMGHAADTGRPKPRSRLLTLPVRTHEAATARSAEDEIPFGDTGTYGRF